MKFRFEHERAVLVDWSQFVGSRGEDLASVAVVARGDERRGQIMRDTGPLAGAGRSASRRTEAFNRLFG